MTTSSGKPPFDEQGLDSSWDAGSAPTGGPDSSSREGLTPRQPAARPPAPETADAASPADQEAAAAAAPVYGTVVPYGGDEHTEEIDPVVLEPPFAPERRLRASGAATPKAPAAAAVFEIQAPAAQVLLSDLFDSVPPSGAMAPPDPAAFSSSRPPPPERPPSDPAPAAGRDPIVGLRNIDIGSDAARANAARGSSPSAKAPAPQRPEPDTQPRVPDPEMSKATVRLPPDLLSSDPEMTTATVKLSRDVVAALGSSPFQSRPSNPPPRAPAPSSPELGDATHSEPASNGAAAMPAPASPSPPSAAQPNPSAPSSPTASSPGHSLAGHSLATHAAPASGAPRFPSEVPTSRPPDVVLSPHAGAASRSPARGERELKAPPAQAMVAVPAISPFKAREASQLPSIMLAADVEAEPDSATRRALRATRATVRLELPPGFGRPGSPVGGAVPGGAVAGSPIPGSPIPGSPAAGGPATGSPVAGGPVSPGSGAIGLMGHAAPAGVGSFVPSAAPIPFMPQPWFANPRTRRLVGAGLAGLLLFITLMFALSPRTGSLVVTALAPGSRAVDDVTIFVDGRPLCDVSPCRIKGLTPGMHLLRASAPNLASQADETVEISAGNEATYNIDLLAVAPEVRSGGMRVPAAETPLTLFIDGKRVGKLPQEVSGLSASKHWIKLDPEDGSPAIEKAVTVLPGEIVDVEPKPAKREKALVTIRLSRGSEGAQVTFDDAFLLDFPAELELEPGTAHTLVATKPGYENLSLDVQVAEGETEKLVEVSLTPVQSSRKSRPRATRKPAPKPAATTASTALADANQGLLNISSVPPSQIILNGRPLGTTPKTGITVPGDSLQTIVFVHPKMGRRRAQKFVPAGKERTVSIRF